MHQNEDEVWEILENLILKLHTSYTYPRFKFGFVEFRLNKTFGETSSVHIDKVDKAIRSLYNGYSSEMEESFNSAAQEGEIASWGKVHSYGNLFLCDNDSFDILHF